MNTTIRIIVKSDESEAGLAEQKLKLKGYKTTVSTTKNVVLDSTDLGGKVEYLTDPDEQVFIVIGSK